MGIAAMLLSEIIDGFEQTPEALVPLMKKFSVMFLDQLGNLRRNDFDTKKAFESFLGESATVVRAISEGQVMEVAPPGMEGWINDRKPEFKERYGKKWQEVLYATAWKQHTRKMKTNEAIIRANNISFFKDIKPMELVALLDKEGGSVRLIYSDDGHIYAWAAHQESHINVAKMLGISNGVRLITEPGDDEVGDDGDIIEKTLVVVRRDDLIGNPVDKHMVAAALAHPSLSQIMSNSTVEYE